MKKAVSCCLFRAPDSRGFRQFRLSEVFIILVASGVFVRETKGT